MVLHLSVFLVNSSGNVNYLRIAPSGEVIKTSFMVHCIQIKRLVRVPSCARALLAHSHSHFARTPRALLARALFVQVSLRPSNTGNIFVQHFRSIYCATLLHCKVIERVVARITTACSTFHATNFSVASAAICCAK